MAALYSETILTVFTEYNEEFDFSLTSKEASSPQSYIQGTDWYLNRSRLRVEIDNAKQAISLASDIGNAQAACDRATEIRENQDKYF